MTQLSKRQEIALRRIGGEWVRGEPMSTTQTLRSLRVRGLVTYDMRGTMGWHLTDAGRETLDALKGTVKP